MNRDEILNMEAGSELDVLVAEKVMGWQKSNPGYERTFWIDSRGVWMHFIDSWSPSTDISAAWDVVVKMENDDYWWTAEDVIPNSDPVVYSCTFSKKGKYYTAEWDFSMPLAICHAVLLTVMESE